MEKTVSNSEVVRYVAPGVFKYIIGGAVLVFATVVTSCSATKVDTGHVGLKVRFGKVVEGPLPANLYFVNPFTTDMVQMDTRVQKWESKTQAYTKDVQQAGVDFVLNYSLDPRQVSVVYQTVGIQWGEKLVGQVVIEEIKREIGQHEAVNLVAQRAIAARTIEANVTKLLAAKNVVVSGLQLTNIDYSDEFEHAVEAKVVAQQNAIQEQNRTVQVREKATQQIETAKGNAEATVLNAKAEAESIRIRANALEANAKLVEWEAVQKWDGKLPVYSMGGAVPFINLNGK
jgi:regulator of protease activity HflC (stomatin/prohibitin superfamily)